MSEKNTIQLKISSIIHVPLYNLTNDFVFIVNGKEFKINRIISDLLSPKISQMHSCDPTIDQYTINTHQTGDFSQILNLVDFNQLEISESNIDFISEVIKILGNESFEITLSNNASTITVENVISLIQKHEKYSEFYSKSYKSEIEFISSHFIEIIEKQKEELKKLSINTLQNIFTNNHLKLNDEDQLLSFINELYQQSNKYCDLYESVQFENASTKSINDFINIFDMNDLSVKIWQMICERLRKEIIKKQKNETRYNQNKKNDETNQNGKKFSYNENNNFSGILNYLYEKTSHQIKNEINITSSSINYNASNNFPENVVLYNDRKNRFISENKSNSWICFDFKEKKVIITDYVIRTTELYGENNLNPKSWVIECSNDNSSWEIVDKQENCQFLNGKNLVHKFSVKNQQSKQFQYIRMRQIDTTWDMSSYYLIIDSFELFGELI